MPGIPQDLKKYAAEFIGTYMLVLTVGMVMNAGADNAWGVASIGFTLMVMIYALGEISGGQFNPAVTFALMQQKAFDSKEGIIYMVVQVLSGLLAGITNGLLFGFAGLATAQPKVGFLFLQALGVELLYTWMLCFVVLNVAVSSKIVEAHQNSYYALAIGFVIIAGGYGGGYISGGCFNPAVTIGINVTGLGAADGIQGFIYCVLYVVAQLLGGFLSVASFHIVRPEEKGQDPESWSPTKLAHQLEGYCPPALSAECIGTYLLVLTLGLNVLAGSPATVFSLGAALMCMIYALGDVSGGHFNPAVTLVVFISSQGRMLISTMVEYMLAQVFGALFAGLTYWLLFLTFTDSTRETNFALVPPSDSTLGQALFGELIATFLLCYVVLTVSQNREFLHAISGLAIAASLMAGVAAVGPLSGGSVNPAVTVAVSVISYVNFDFTFQWIFYLLAEFLGAGLAAVVYLYVTHTGEQLSFAWPEQHRSWWSSRVQGRERGSLDDKRGPLLMVA